MALYHFHVTQIKRSEGRTAVASAAYRAGEKLHNLWDGETHDYTKKGGVILAEIMLPEYAPERFFDRSTLWNEVEQVEKNYNAQLAYSFDMALQNEFSLEENIELAREFVQKYFVSDGMICDLGVHQPDKEEGGIPNPHFHVLAPIRPLNEDGTWGAKQRREYHLDENSNRIKKENGGWEFDAVSTTNWGRPETLNMWRQAWADIVNDKFREKGLECRIDHRSYVNQGLDLIPTVHEGPQIRKMEKKGIRTEKGELNRWIKATNRMLRSMRATIAALKEWIQEAKEILKEPQEIYLAQLLSEAHTMRNQTAITYTRGKTKAKKSNMNKQTRLKELQQLVEDAKTYSELKPIFDEMKKEKYRFTKAKEKYKAEYEGELRRFYMVKRKLKEKGFEKEPFPLSAWQKEFSELLAQRENEYQKYKLMQKDLTLLYQIKGDVDKVMRETHPEILHTDKTKETTL